MKMSSEYHTVVIGGGCLGVASALSISRRRVQAGQDQGAVCIVEKQLVSSGLSARHSGIVRSANSDPSAAELAKHASNIWLNLSDFWGARVQIQEVGAVWIARDDGDGRNKKWDMLSKSIESSGIDFGQISLDEAREHLPDFVRVNKGEVFYFEPHAFQLDPSNVRDALYKSLRNSSVVLKERTEVIGFERNDSGSISSVITDKGRLTCKYIINAAGPWSPGIFSSVGLSIPVSVEPVYVANWLTSQSDLSPTMPVIADYVNLAYFRTWRDGEIHMHQPRKRSSRETARAFAENSLGILGADFINDPMNQALGYSQLKIYEDIVRRRFKNFEKAVYGSGYRSYFDITPDLRFILGPDNAATNVIHCLGSGQALKYAPVFGELMADYVIGDTGLKAIGDKFSISRFDDSYMKEFWSRVGGSENSLSLEAHGL